MNGEIRVMYSLCSKTKTTEDSVVYNGYGIEAHSCLTPLCRVDDITCAEEEAGRPPSGLY